VRVALVIERFEPRGGVERVAWQVAHALAAAGDEVHVVARKASASEAVQLHLVRVPSHWHPWRVLAFSNAAARAAPRGAFDVVHSFSRTRHQDLFRAGGGSHAEYMERQYGRPGGGGSGLWWRRASPRHRVLLGIERRVFADASQFIQCNSRMVQRELMRRYAIPDERLVLLYNGVDLERFHPSRRATDGASLRAEFGAGDAPVWLFVGSGFRRKGLDTALRALAATGGDAVLWVAGSDDTKDWRSQARALGVAARVCWLGAARDVAALYAAADALILPTRYDAFANVCLEAAAAGIPVITTASNGAAEVLADGGIIVPDAEDGAGFAQALERLADPAERRKRGAAARAVAERYGWPQHITALRALYARIARR
jgi:UDP-glucose:(heptosyl)LPS alpha-1,3-glucosyltransferase